MFYGPNNLYVYTGYGLFAAHPSFNSITINVTGGRKITFHDGTVITWGHATVISWNNKILGILR
jgi:hypothetical protein